MQEQVDREAIAITVKASRLTGRALAKTFGAVLRKIQNEHRKAQTPRGKQSVKKLMNHNAATGTIEVSGDSGLFDKVARKWNVDYAFHKTGPDKYLLLFKTGQADAITACFSEYAALVMNRAKDKRPPVIEQFKKAAEKAASERPQRKGRRREREAARE